MIREALGQYLERSNQGRPLPTWVGGVDVPGTDAGALKRELRQGWITELERRLGEGDVPRIRELIRRYGDLPLTFADACVVVCAERNGGRVLTFGRRDFDVVAGEGIVP